MTGDPIETLLRDADVATPGHRLVPPSTSHLEHLRRRQVPRRAPALVLIALPVLGMAWTVSHRVLGGTDGVPSATERLAASMKEFDDTLASLRRRSPAPSVASESAATATFRTLRRGAARGDEVSIEGLRWLAEHFPRTHGGRCARLFLDTTMQ